MMTPDTLIIRSTSTQNLEKLAPSILAGLAPRGVDVLTHGEGTGSIREKFPDAGIVPYPFAEDFSFRRIWFGEIPGLTPGRYKTVVVPMSNRSGAGYLNVFLLAWVLHPDRIVSCDKQGTLRTVSKSRVVYLTAKEGLLVVPTLFLTALMVAGGTVCLAGSWILSKWFKRAAPVRSS
jgi:hypothetical protein